MTGEDYELEKALIEMCDASCELSTTPRIRVKREEEWKLNDTSREYFLRSLEGPDRILLKDFIHCDTWCNASNMVPSYWRVQGFMCLSNMLDYVESEAKAHSTSPDLVFFELFKKIEFDKWHSTENWLKGDLSKGEYIVIEYKKKTWIKILEYKALHRFL